MVSNPSDGDSDFLHFANLRKFFRDNKLSDKRVNRISESHCLHTNRSKPTNSGLILFCLGINFHRAGEREMNQKKKTSRDMSVETSERDFLIR